MVRLWYYIYMVLLRMNSKISSKLIWINDKWKVLEFIMKYGFENLE